MAHVIDDQTKIELEKAFMFLVQPVHILFFTQKNAMPTCEQQHELLKEVCALSDKLMLEVYDFVENKDSAQKYALDKIPATVLVGKKDYGIRFYGLTAGYEFESLITDILMVSTEKSNLDPQLELLVKDIKVPVHIQVLVTLTCQYCPSMVHVAHQFAFVNEHITADMVELAEFPQISQQYSANAVPKTIVNETNSFDGALPAPAVYVKLIEYVSPQDYPQAELAIRRIQGNFMAKDSDQNHVYEVAIVGGGPAGMSAALYAARKGLDVVIIAGKLGGQINYTADIGNYLGFPHVSGADMTQVFRSHMEKFPVAEAIGFTVKKIEKTESGFSIFTDDTRHFSALSVVYAAGKEYLRLGVPGEDHFVGKGIGFCATCDAPLYLDKRVAVVGGGNSAFTAVRDLIDFASEIHLISRSAEFKADAPLIEEVEKSAKVKIHTQSVVREFVGTDVLKGVRVESLKTKTTWDLPLQGVFLEIGLVPNSQALKGFIAFDKYGQIPVQKDLSTTVTGFFAAGDITDTEEKQIAIAVGQGAQAAISAYKYLKENKLTKSNSMLKETWE